MNKKRIMIGLLMASTMLCGCSSATTVDSNNEHGNMTSGTSTSTESVDTSNAIVTALKLANGDEVETTICRFSDEWEIEYDTTAVKRDGSGGEVSVGYRYTPYNNVSEEAAEIVGDISDWENPEHNLFTISTPTGDASVIVYPSNGGDEHSFIDIVQPLPDNYKGVLTISVCEWPNEDGKGAHTWKELSKWNADDVAEYVGQFLFTGEGAATTENEDALPIVVTSVANVAPEYEDPGFGTVNIDEEVYVNADEHKLTLLDGVSGTYNTLYYGSSKSVGVFDDDDLSTTYHETLRECANKHAANSSKNGSYKVYESADGNTFVTVYTNPTDEYDKNYVYVHVFRQLGYVDYTEYKGEPSESDCHEMVYRETSAIVDMDDEDEVTELVENFRDYLGVEIEVR